MVTMQVPLDMFGINSIWIQYGFNIYSISIQYLISIDTIFI